MAPGLCGALLAARAAGHSHLTVDGTLIHRPLPRPGSGRPGARTEARVDLWWSGKHAAHGGNVQVIATPDGWWIGTSDVRPGREHDPTAQCAHAEVLRLLAECTDQTHAAPADLGYEGERAMLTTPIKHRVGRRSTGDQRTANLLDAATRARPNAATPRTRRPSRRGVGSVSAPCRVGAITAAARVLLHHEHDRTT